MGAGPACRTPPRLAAARGGALMFDAVLRRRLEGPLDRLAAVVDRPWLSPDRLTLLGLATGLASAVGAAAQWWGPALVLWLVSRGLDGLDGPLARRRRRGTRAEGDPGAGEAGGFLDITCDFAVYGASVVGVALGVVGADPGAGAGTWLAFLAVLAAYYLNGTAFLAFSSIAERTGHRLDDGRSLSFLGGLAEGAETIAVHALWLLLPGLAVPLATVWAGLVGLSAAHRVAVGYRTLRRAPSSPPPGHGG